MSLCGILVILLEFIGMAATVTPLGARNPLCTNIRKAVQKGLRTDDGLVVAEGFHLVAEARRSRCPLEVVIATPSALQNWALLDSCPPETRIFSVDPHTFSTFSTTDSPQGILALVRLPDWTLADLLARPALVVLLDGLQDPGNAGAIVRSAEAFGATGVVFLRGSASPYHPKTLRAAAGSLFRLPFLAAAELPVFDFPVYATAKSAAQPIDAVDWRQSCGFVIGSEGQGVRPEILAACQPVTIPTETVESLNAAVAAGIVLYEARRQRSRP
jgi:TrmH family RNA methyltransferase